MNFSKKSFASFILLGVIVLSSFSLNVTTVNAVFCASPNFDVSTLDDGSNADDVEVVDIDQDGDLDILASNFFVDVQMFLNDGDGNFTYSAIDLGIDGVREIDVVNIDPNIDADIDIIVTDQTDDKVYLFTNDGTEDITDNFTSTEIISAAGVRDAMGGDPGNGGGLDVIIVSDTTNSVTTYFNDETNSFPSGTLLDANLSGAFELDVDDVDGDGDYDVLASGYNQGGGSAGTELYINEFYVNDPLIDEGLNAFVEVDLGNLGDASPLIADIDGDGDLDLFKIRGGLYYYENDGTTDPTDNFTETYMALNGFNPGSGLNAEDIDDDGDVDLALAGLSDGYGWLENDGEENFANTDVVITDPGFGQTDVGIGDFDEDGLMDLVGVSTGTDPTTMTQTCDTTDPTAITLSPADDAVDIALDANLVITFDEDVNVESGNVTIYQASDDTEIEAIDITSLQVTGDGTDTITIDPTDDLGSETDYYVQIDATAIDDLVGNSFAGIADTTTWSFTTVDATDPTVLTLAPTDDATEVEISSNLVVTFDEEVNVEVGNVTIYDSDDTEIEAIDITSGQVTGDGTDTITIDPTADFEYETSFYVQIDATAIDDLAGNSFAGIADTTTWNFTSDEQPSTGGGSRGGGGFSSSISSVINQNNNTEDETSDEAKEDSEGSDDGDESEDVTEKEESEDIEDLDVTEELDNLFNDVDILFEKFEVIKFFYEKGVVEGYSDGEFKPTDDINRAEMFKILVTQLGIEAESKDCFENIIGKWYESYVCYAKEQGWIRNFEGNEFNASESVTISEAASVLSLVFGIDIEASGTNLITRVEFLDMIYESL